MSFLNRFKKEEKKGKAPETHVSTPVQKTVREEREAAEQAGVLKKATKVATVSASGGRYAHAVLLRPIVSEKSAHVHSFNQYVFKVSPSANKISIKKAIKETYDIEPLEVRIIRVQGKTVTRGRMKGRRSSYKKAIIRMPKGTTLPIYEGV